MMDQVLAMLEFARCYIDDIRVFSATTDELKLLHFVFEQLQSHGLKLHPLKCRFYQTNIEY